MVDPASDLPVTNSLTIPARELTWRFSRSSGPGGQSVNTTDSRVELRWDPSRSTVLNEAQRDRLRYEIVVVAAEHRSQLQNRLAARKRLVERITAALASRPKRRRRTRPTAGSVTRRLDAKRRRSQVKAARRRPGPSD